MNQLPEQPEEPLTHEEQSRRRVVILTVMAVVIAPVIGFLVVSELVG